MKYGLIYTAVLMVIGTAITEIVPDAFASLFNAGQSSVFHWSDAGDFNQLSLCGNQCGISGNLSGTGKRCRVPGDFSAQTVCDPIAAGWYFSVFVRNGQADVSLIWWAFPITELAACLVGYALLKKVKRTGWIIFQKLL